MSATHHLSFFSQARIGQEGATPALASFGDVTTYFQAEAKAFGNLYSTPNVQLDAKTLVQGFIRTAGEVGRQGVGTGDEPVVNGGIFTGVEVTPAVVSWTVQWPSSTLGERDYWAVPAPTDHVLEPGAYGRLNVHDRNRVFLSSGV
jgi:hypothetical protein